MSGGRTSTAAALAKSDMLLPVAVLVVMALSGLGSILAVRGRIKQLVEDRHGNSARYAYYLAKGRQLNVAEHQDEALLCFRAALSLASNSAMRVEGSLNVAELLADGIEKRSAIDVGICREFAEAVISGTDNPVFCRRAFNALLAAAKAQGDYRTVMSANESLFTLAETDEQKTVNLLTRLTLAFDKFGYSEAHAITGELARLEVPADLQEDVALAKALVKERVATDPAWRKQAVDLMPAGSKPPSVASCIEAAIVDCEKLVNSQRVRTAAEASFRCARLHMAAGERDKAVRYVTDVIGLATSLHQAEVLDIIRKWRDQSGDSVQVRELLNAFVAQFPWNSVSVDDLLAVTDGLAAMGRTDDAMKIMMKFSSMPLKAPGSGVFLSRAIDLGLKLDRTDDVERIAELLLAMDESEAHTGKAILACAEVARRKKDFATASVWVSRYLAAFPCDRKKNEVLLRLFDIERERKASAVALVAIALEAVEEKSADDMAMPVLLKASRILEDMGMFALASEQYDRIVILYRLMPADDRNAARLKPEIAEAMLGSARCYLRTGERVKADRLLREISNLGQPEVVLSEAALHWALMAFQDRQYMEARRRLGICKPDLLPRVLKPRAAILEKLVDVASGKASKEQVMAVIEASKSLTPDEERTFVTSVYSVCLNRLIDLKARDEMVQLFRAAAQGGHASSLPLGDFSMRIALFLVTNAGMADVDAFAKESAAALSKAGHESNQAVGRIGDIAAKLARHSMKVEKLK